MERPKDQELTRQTCRHGAPPVSRFNLAGSALGRWNESPSDSLDSDLKGRKLSELRIMPMRNPVRAARYRELAFAEKDQVKSAMLRRLAEEADRGVLCTAHKFGQIYLAHNASAGSQRSFLDVGGGRLGFL
jgi:hypothetical protein